MSLEHKNVIIDGDLNLDTNDSNDQSFESTFPALPVQVFAMLIEMAELWAQTVLAFFTFVMKSRSGRGGGGATCRAPFSRRRL